jgi:adenylate kinase family enzyme
MKIIIIQGGGATGKSTLAKELERIFGIPIFSKDDYRLARYAFNKTSFTDWFKLEKKSYGAVYEAIEAAIQNDKSLILEGNFSLSHRKEFHAALANCKNIIEIDCYTKGFIAARRYIVRNREDDVSEGFRDYLRYIAVVLEAICSIVGLGWYRNLGLTKNVMNLETSDPNKIDYKPIIEFVRSIN